MAAITPVECSRGYNCLDQMFRLDSGEIITIRMSRRDAERACEDNEYAAQIIANYNETQQPVNAPDNVEQVLAPVEAELLPDNNQTRLSQKWTDAATTLLVHTREEMGGLFSSKHLLGKECWRLVSEGLLSKGYAFDGEQCNSKWRSLLKMYRKVMDHNSKSGNSRKTWLHLADMDRILGTRPEMTAVATASSTGLETVRSVADILPQPLVTLTPQLKKRRTMEEIILQSMAEKKARHEEKMEFKRDALKLFKEMAGFPPTDNV